MYIKKNVHLKIIKYSLDIILNIIIIFIHFVNSKKLVFEYNYNKINCKSWYKMLNLNNNATNVKKELLIKLTKLQLDGKLDTKEINHIPKEIAPRDKSPIGCCIFHDREILRMRILAKIGISVEKYNEETELEDYAAEALNRESPTWPMLTVLHDACNACVKQDYIVTNACQGCFARPCRINCPKKAIDI